MNSLEKLARNFVISAKAGRLLALHRSAVLMLRTEILRLGLQLEQEIELPSVSPPAPTAAPAYSQQAEVVSLPLDAFAAR